MAIPADIESRLKQAGFTHLASGRVEAVHFAMPVEPSRVKDLFHYVWHHERFAMERAGKTPVVFVCVGIKSGEMFLDGVGTELTDFHNGTYCDVMGRGSVTWLMEQRKTIAAVLGLEENLLYALATLPVSGKIVADSRLN